MVYKAEKRRLFPPWIKPADTEPPPLLQILDEVQKLVDNLNLQSYTNLTRWVNDLDLKVTAGVICTCTVHVLYYMYYKGLGEINYFNFL